MTPARQLSIFDVAAPVVEPVRAKPVYSLPPPPPPSGRQLRDEAIRQVADNADAAWMERAENVIRSLCCERGREELTSDDVWTHLGEDSPREPRALGAVFRRCMALGIIEKTGRVVQSKRRENHARDIAIWRCS